MLLKIVIEESLGNQHIHQAAHAARQHDLVWVNLKLSSTAQR